MNWQPIDTAPKDGTKILLGTWAPTSIRRLPWFVYDIGRWTDMNGGGWVRNYVYQPQFWQPLPLPPGETR